MTVDSMPPGILLVITNYFITDLVLHFARSARWGATQIWALFPNRLAQSFTRAQRVPDGWDAERNRFFRRGNNIGHTAFLGRNTSMPGKFLPPGASPPDKSVRFQSVSNRASKPAKPFLSATFHLEILSTALTSSCSAQPVDRVRRIRTTAPVFQDAAAS